LDKPSLFPAVRADEFVEVESMAAPLPASISSKIEDLMISPCLDVAIATQPRL